MPLTSLTSFNKIIVEMKKNQNHKANIMKYNLLLVKKNINYYLTGFNTLCLFYLDDIKPSNKKFNLKSEPKAIASNRSWTIPTHRYACLESRLRNCRLVKP